MLTDLSGFKIYYGTAQDNLTSSITISDANALSFVLNNLQVDQTYFFAVVAYNSAGIESELSQTVSKLIGS